ncbi:hypothetical protein SERLADRAFT_437511 [Serpula lacrymans var. lacrymans S7.9]|uniref:Uncharacterized protein n=1 Tax=Serpula lacrymans var. lacrymans (strain S7.9) TaxID=578457 RepID=F8NTV7_SERL9|nr:uncharacterized protein SERLADRAFT_437511 [Serpula lacrymans var. lacrymans S7.9]EGO25777.1 hypothetical protein SERLADRAFT_437511 [Serpula lacrymans var. lacrymans S7.9]
MPALRTPILSKKLGSEIIRTLKIRSVFVNSLYFPASSKKHRFLDVAVLSPVPTHADARPFPVVEQVLGTRFPIHDAFVEVTDPHGVAQEYLVCFQYHEHAPINKALLELCPQIFWKGDILVLKRGTRKWVRSFRGTEEKYLAKCAVVRYFFGVPMKETRPSIQYRLRFRKFPETPYRAILRSLEDDIPILRQRFPLQKVMKRRGSAGFFSELPLDSTPILRERFPLFSTTTEVQHKVDTLAPSSFSAPLDLISDDLPGPIPDYSHLASATAPLFPPSDDSSSSSCTSVVTPSTRPFSHDETSRSLSTSSSPCPQIFSYPLASMTAMYTFPPPPHSSDQIIPSTKPSEVPLPSESLTALAKISAQTSDLSVHSSTANGLTPEQPCQDFSSEEHLSNAKDTCIDIVRTSHKIRNLEKHITVFESKGNCAFSVPPPVVSSQTGDIFIHRYGISEKMQIWVRDSRSNWGDASLGDTHPFLFDYRLNMSSQGKLSWVTKKTVSTYRGRDRKRSSGKLQSNRPRSTI